MPREVGHARVVVELVPVGRPQRDSYAVPFKRDAPRGPTRDRGSGCCGVGITVCGCACFVRTVVQQG